MYGQRKYILLFGKRIRIDASQEGCEHQGNGFVRVTFDDIFDLLGNVKSGLGSQTMGLAKNTVEEWGRALGQRYNYKSLTPQ